MENEKIEPSDKTLDKETYASLSDIEKKKLGGESDNDTFDLTDEDQKVGKIYVKDISDKLISIDYSKNLTILDVKNFLSEKIGVSCSEQRLVFDGMQLEDTKTLDDYKIIKDSTLKLMCRLDGGSIE